MSNVFGFQYSILYGLLLNGDWSIKAFYISYIIIVESFAGCLLCFITQNIFFSLSVKTWMCFGLHSKSTTLKLKNVNLKK